MFFKLIHAYEFYFNENETHACLFYVKHVHFMEISIKHINVYYFFFQICMLSKNLFKCSNLFSHTESSAVCVLLNIRFSCKIPCVLNSFCRRETAFNIDDE